MSQREPVSSPRRRADRRRSTPVYSYSRDLTSEELWQRSLERSRRRRELAPIIRKRKARKRNGRSGERSPAGRDPAVRRREPGLDRLERRRPPRGVGG